MDGETLIQKLAGLSLGAVRYIEKTGSTNDDAARWASAGAPDLSLLVADEQTAGRGRLGRQWFTPRGAALAFSLVLRPDRSVEQDDSLSNEGQEPSLPYPSIGRLTALGAVATSEALLRRYGLAAQIKWPNDVLLDGRKVAGILAEAHWQGDRLLAVILGIGINVTPAALPAEERLLFPATSVEAVLQQPVDRLDLLRAVLEELLTWRARLDTPEFLRMWEDRLAYKDEWVELVDAGVGEDSSPVEGHVLGLEVDGSLRLRDRRGQVFTLHIGEVRLRPVDRPPG